MIVIYLCKLIFLTNSDFASRVTRVTEKFIDSGARLLFISRICNKSLF